MFPTNCSVFLTKGGTIRDDVYKIGSTVINYTLLPLDLCCGVTLTTFSPFSLKCELHFWQKPDITPLLT